MQYEEAACLHSTPVIWPPCAIMEANLPLIKLKYYSEFNKIFSTFYFEEQKYRIYILTWILNFQASFNKHDKQVYRT